MASYTKEKRSRSSQAFTNTAHVLRRSHSPVLESFFILRDSAQSQSVNFEPYVKSVLQTLIGCLWTNRGFYRMGVS